MSKPYSYLSEKSYILKRRNLNTNKNLNDKILLNQYNYYNLINAYKEPFLKRRTHDGEEHYKDDVEIEHLEALYIFDTKIRSLFLTNILKIEEEIKHNLIESFYLINNPLSDCLEVESEYLHKKYYNLMNLYSKNQFDLNSKKFHIEYSENEISRNNLIIDRTDIYYNFVSNTYRAISKQKSNRSSNRSVSSYLENHEVVPLWILANHLTLGNISYFYIIQKKEVQELFLKKIGFYNKKDISLTELIFNTSNILRILTLCRNICAHNERLYNYDVKIPISDNYLSFSKSLPYHEAFEDGSMDWDKSNKRKGARGGLYSFIFSIYIFLDSKEKSQFIKEINKNLLELKNKVNKRDYDFILSIIGLNFDWSNLIKNSKIL